MVQENLHEGVTAVRRVNSREDEWIPTATQHLYLTSSGQCLPNSPSDPGS